jgi:hypothetical protein
MLRIMCKRTSMDFQGKMWMTATLMLECNGQTHGSGRYVFQLTRDCRSANNASSLARGSSEAQVFSFQDSASACPNSDPDVWLIGNL